MCIYIYIYICSAPPRKIPFQYSHLSRVQPSNSFVDVILSFCRRERWDIALHCIALYYIVLQSGGTDLAWIMRGSARAVPPGLGESRPGLDVVEGLEVSTLRCDEQGSGTTLHCDALVGVCVREQADHLLAPLLTCDEQKEPRHPALRCPCRPLHQRADSGRVVASPCSSHFRVDTSRWSVCSLMLGPTRTSQTRVMPPSCSSHLRRTTSRCPLSDAMSKGVASCIAMSLSAPAPKQRQQRKQRKHRKQRQQRKHRKQRKQRKQLKSCSSWFSLFSLFSKTTKINENNENHMFCCSRCLHCLRCFRCLRFFRYFVYFRCFRCFSGSHVCSSVVHFAYICLI